MCIIKGREHIHIWLALACVTFLFNSKAQACTVLTATEDIQYFYSHTLYGIQDYHNSMYECWEIKAENAEQVIELSVGDFSVEEDADCLYDYVVIYDGFYGSHIGTYCGTGFTGILESSEDTMSVEFVTDDSLTEKGFKLGYQARDSSEGLSTSMIVLIAVLSALGVILVITIIIICIVCIIKKKNKKSTQVNFSKPFPQQQQVAMTGNQYTGNDHMAIPYQGTSIAVSGYYGDGKVPPPAVYYEPQQQMGFSGQTNNTYMGQLDQPVLPPLV